MQSNDVVLLNRMLEERLSPTPSDRERGENFEQFTAELILRDEDISIEEINSGIVGGGRDGGVDSIYTFLHGQLLAEDSDQLRDEFDVTNVPRNAELRLVIIQSKLEQSFRESAIDKLKDTFEYLTDMSLDLTLAKQIYASDLIEKFGIFKSVWEKYNARSLRFKIEFHYATRGKTSDISSALKVRGDILKRSAEDIVIGESSIAVNFLGARELWVKGNAQPSYNLQLQFEDYVTKGDSYSGLVTIPEYYNFISDDSGQIRQHLFDFNVRDYQGKVTVNKGIRSSLEGDGNVEFWWLNNGVTILCSRVNISGSKTFALEDVQVVNGMQTSHVIHEVLSTRHKDGSIDELPAWSVHVRVIQTSDETVRDQIIRATNSQTKVDDASLHATEDIHREIESYFKSHNWFYDRRKNFHKNQGRPVDRIVGISALAQFMMAIGMSRPNDARARPSTLLKKTEDYNSVFGKGVSLETFLGVTKMQKSVDRYLSTSEIVDSAYVKTNCRFYVGMYIVASRAKDVLRSPTQLKSEWLESDGLDQEKVDAVIDVVLSKANDLNLKHGWALDRSAKSGELADLVAKHALSSDRVPV
ncbi:AIPR family protein [Brevibacterium sp. BDJS002]|uniref:AIPR family protein n=1 Tax=Brevibacterium sp. BDJS002 TaxID=3020906 RepID=UPI0023077419|nr:AIPR family protein [Brevibacterium sp. BDJS002]WCE38796.1 AIPR family protein [Brevibacterium sp. BDJS002]